MLARVITGPRAPRGLELKTTTGVSFMTFELVIVIVPAMYRNFQGFTISMACMITSNQWSRYCCCSCLYVYKLMVCTARVDY